MIPCLYILYSCDLYATTVWGKTTVKHAFLGKKLSILISALSNTGFSVALWVMWNTAFRLHLYLNAPSDVISLECLLPDMFVNVRSLNILTTKLQNSGVFLGILGKRTYKFVKGINVMLHHYS